jgi:hypothetical protein
VSVAAEPLALALRRERSFDWADPVAALARAAGLSGLETMRAIIAGELPPPPIARLLAIELVEAEPGCAILR